MKRKQAKQATPKGTVCLDDTTYASAKLTAIQVAAGLPEAEPAGHGLMAGGPGRPGKSAEKVIDDAEKIIAFVTRRY